LAKWRIGAVLVRNADGKIVGIVSERDLIHALATDAAAILHRKVLDLMTGEVVTCQSLDSLQSVMEKMTHGRFRHLPVIDDGELRGIVSIGDVVKLRIAEQLAEADALKAYIASG
jgi:CBS domain-containing protein